MDPTTAAAAAAATGPVRTPAPSLSLEARRVALRLQALHTELDVIEPAVTRLAQTVRALAPLEPVLARLATLATTAAAAAAPNPTPVPSAVTPTPATEPAPATVPPPPLASATHQDGTPPPFLTRTLPDLHPPPVPARRSTRRSTTLPAAGAAAADEPFFLDAAAYFAGDPYAPAGTSQASLVLPSPPSSQRTGPGKKRARGEATGRVVVDPRDDASHTARGKRARRATTTPHATASQPAVPAHDEDEDDGFALLFGSTQP
ncbi:hypothetical protein AMAG_07159 [Allomyces macrogynus ATCC 38327]|uniref:Uncharacterized protein n=1 Tax=Allomyces macrogynus (strain ATCC 38327) TaxID=578462 RepID=A0A0L0SHM7_ALLM3|nr:hypothetical protein AMAG_07159 [Allomyces macrogynus ATCC 38327]|eukprot:KNE61890.1 hypothetical protein AMAG_07159 [Allomyces macrogynus ATCC 38327]